jgi:hypothetical protein
MPLLSEDDYLATMGGKRQVLRPEDAAAIGVGSYVRGIDRRDMRGYDFSALAIANVYSMDDGAWQHVLVSASVPNVFLVVVLDGQLNAVHGHHVLDLNEKYGLND